MIPSRIAIAGLLLVWVWAGCSCDNRPAGTKDAATNPASAAGAAFVASRMKEPFHRPECEWARKIEPENLETYFSRQTAVRAGHRPCQVCNP